MNRSSLAIALAGALAGGALLFAFLGLFQPLFWLAAVASGASSYWLWRYGQARIIAEAYGETDRDDRTATDDSRARRVATEDWHRGGFEYRSGDTSPSDDDWDDWRWPGEFWRDDPRSRDGRGHTADPERPTDGTTASGRGRTRSGDEETTDGRWGDPWREDDPKWWGGWAEETGEDWTRGGTTDDERSDRRSAGESTGDDGGTGSTGRRRPTGQRQLSRAREEAADVLGVAPDASPDTVREAYRERAKETHPDRGGDVESFRRVRWAYEQLRQ